MILFFYVQNVLSPTLILSVRELFMNEHMREKALEEFPNLNKLKITEVNQKKND
jgi:hypothetical protein